MIEENPIAKNINAISRSLFFFLLLSSGAFGQVFYVEPTEKGYEKKISEKLNYDGYKVASEPSLADFKIECLVL